MSRILPVYLAVPRPIDAENPMVNINFFLGGGGDEIEMRVAEDRE